MSLFLGPAVLLSESSRSSGGKRRGNVMPLLPGQQSLAERVAQRKNRILQTRLQSDLNTITRDKRSYLSGLHKDACHYRQRAGTLKDVLARPTSSRTRDTTLPSSCASSSPAVDKARHRRPATSMALGREGGQRSSRPKTSGFCRPATAACPVKDRNKPLFKVRVSRVAGASSDDEDSDYSEDESLTSDSDDSERAGATKVGTVSFGRHTPKDSAALGKVGSKGYLLQSPQRTFHNRDVHPSKHPEQIRIHNPDSKQARRGVPGTRSVSSLGRIMSTDRTGKPGANATHQSSSQKRPHTAVARPDSSRAPAATPIFLSPRDPKYIRFVLAMERDQYEQNQMKIRSYLQNLKV